MALRRLLALMTALTLLVVIASSAQAARFVHFKSPSGDIGPLCIKGSVPCSTLGYGRAITVGRIRCVSATAGVTCRRTDGRRVGFTVSREGYRLYR